MQKVLSILIITSILSVSSTFAAEVTDTVTAPTSAPTSTVASPDTDSSGDAIPTLTAAPVLSSTMGSDIGEYKAVACSTNPAFSVNSCNQCFVGGSLKAGESLTGLFDNWTNSSASMLVAYKDEQKTPNMVSFGNTVWTSTPTDLTKFWKNSADITWVPTGASGSRMNYILPAGQKVRFVEAELGARYTLEKTDKKDGEIIGLLRFPVVSRVVDGTTGAEGAATTHYECVSYSLSTPNVATPPITPQPVTPPTPGEVTQTKTGPAETLILILAAFFIAFGMMFSLRKRN